MGETLWGALIVTWQTPVPEQSPPQPVNVEVEAGGSSGESVTTVPGAKSSRQVVPQEMPGGLLMIVPLPFPDLETDSVKAGGCGVTETLPEAGLWPTTFTAFPEQLYAVPLVSGDTVMGEPDPDAVTGPGRQETM